MNWAIQIEISANTPALPPNRQTTSARQEAWGRKIAPSDSGSTKGMKGRYWSHDIAEWLAQQASPFWNTLRKGGSAGDAGAAYIGARLWQATGGRVVKFAAKQSLKQMALRPAAGMAGVTLAYFATVPTDRSSSVRESRSAAVDSVPEGSASGRKPPEDFRVQESVLYSVDPPNESADQSLLRGTAGRCLLAFAVGVALCEGGLDYAWLLG